MSFSQKLVIILAAASAGALGLSSAALAGEGGAAGSAAFTINANAANGAVGAVTGVAVSAGIGKQDAFAGAFNNLAGDNAAFAVGSAGVMNINTLNATEISSIGTVADTQIAAPQANSFAATTSVQIGTIGGDAVVVVGP